MKIETVHEMGMTYFVISEAKIQEDNNMSDMLLRNELKGIMKPNLRRIDGNLSFYYGISGLQT
ncbi:MAG: DUF6382 domain-containing protein, partial [Lachnoclostridium sp.]|nr:DUF6382 domain-containing protein [Lachnoclostridium sp.]